MELKELEVKNFLVFGDDLQKINLDGLGLILLEGINDDSESFEANGAGKSSLLEGVVYALYGKTSDGSSGDSLINNKVGKGMYVSLTFVKDGHTYTIKRYRKDKKFKNKSLLFLDEKEVTKSSIKATNEYLETIIGMDINTYLHSVMFGMEDIVPFTQATDKEKKNILEDVANISIYKKAEDLSKARLKEYKSRLEIETNNLASHNNVLNSLELANKERRDSFKRSAEYKKNLEDKIKALNEKIDNFDSNNSGMDGIIVSDKLKAYQQKLNELTIPDMKSTINEYNALREKLVSLGKDSKNINAELDRYKKQIVDLVQSKSNICEYCGSVLDEDHKKKEIASLTKLAKEDTLKIQRIESDISNNKDNYLELKNKVSNYNELLDKYKQDSAKINSKISELNASLVKINSATNEYNSWNDQVENLKNALSSVTAPKESTDYESEISKEKESMKEIQEKIDTLNSKISSYTDVVSVYSDRGVKSQVLDLVLPYLNQRANYYLSDLSENTISIKLNPQTKAGNGNVSEKLNIDVDNLNGSKEYAHNSTGEKKRIDLSISLALQDYVLTQSDMQTNFIAYDEVFDGLDGAGIDKLITILRNRVKKVSTIIVVSHNSELKELFENSIVVHKERGKSKIEY